MSFAEWKDIADVSSADRQQVIRLAGYGAILLRARRVFAQDYEPKALAEKENAISAKIEAERAELKRREESGEKVVWPLPAPGARGDKPEFEDVPLRRGMETCAEIPSGILALLDPQAWSTGVFEYVDPDDRRRRWLMEGLQVIDADAGRSAAVPKRPRGRPKGLGYKIDDVPDFQAMRQLIDQGRPITTAAKDIAWARYPNEPETRVTRLRKDYATWLAAQDGGSEDPPENMPH